jgi:hypothetical protein
VADRCDRAAGIVVITPGSTSLLMLNAGGDARCLNFAVVRILFFALTVALGSPYLSDYTYTQYRLLIYKRPV